MKILVTGATGFVGQHTVQALLQQGHEVIATSTSRAKAQFQPWFDHVTFVDYDMAHDQPTQNLFDLFKRPDTLIHLAWPDVAQPTAITHIQHLFAHYSFLQKLITDGLANLTVAGTCLEYGLQSGTLFETLHTEPTTPYGLAKDCLRKFLEALQQTQPFRLTWLRLFYMYGEGQHSNSLFAQLNRAIDKKEEAFFMSGGEQLRDYLPIEEVASLVSRLAVQNQITGIINCCSGKPISVRQLVETYLQERRATLTLKLGYYPYRDFEPMAFWGSTDKLMQALNHE